MNLGRYPGEVCDIAEEILYEFSEEDISELSQLLKKLGFQGWLEWKRKNHELITNYIEVTPSQRNRLKKFKTHMPQLAFAAYQQCLAGHCVLQAIESNFLFPGQSYRRMAASAANAYYEICESIEHELWPWGDDPFGVLK